MSARRNRRNRRHAELNELVDSLASKDFEERHGKPAFAPITIVIPSYGESDNIEGVLADIPRNVGGLDVSALVVVDGNHPAVEHDTTAEKVVKAGDYVAVAPVNRGQGAALRLAYTLARDHGAKYIVSLDADGQYDPSELERLVEPLEAGTADFVSGSRRLGRKETTDKFRTGGVYVFATLISVLTGTKITDPANGFRAMRSEVTADVALTEEQYQASELLIGAIERGYRVTEVGVLMRERASGESKKQHNMLYGLQFARVIFKTVLRDRKAAKQRAAA